MHLHAGRHNNPKQTQLSINKNKRKEHREAGMAAQRTKRESTPAHAASNFCGEYSSTDFNPIATSREDIAEYSRKNEKNGSSLESDSENSPNPSPLTRPV